VRVARTLQKQLATLRFVRATSDCWGKSMIPAQYCRQVARNFDRLAGAADLITQAATHIIKALDADNKVILCGNGGSAADSQHLAAELVGRYKLERRALPALALTVDTSALTAIANDYAFSDVFSRQLAALGRRGDVLIALSTSGDSANVLNVISAARPLGLFTIGLTGETGGKMREACDLCLCMPSRETNHIQEMHIAVGHMMCGLIEQALCSARS